MVNNKEKLLKFIYDARFKCKYKVRKDGWKTIIYDNLRFYFYDLYRGYEVFSGRIIVGKKFLFIKSKNPLYEVNYSGEIIGEDVKKDNETVKKIYSIVKKGFGSGFDKITPYKRGANYLMEDEYEYFSTLTGDIRIYSNREIILHKGKLCYAYKDVGVCREDKNSLNLNQIDNLRVNNVTSKICILIIDSLKNEILLKRNTDAKEKISFLTSINIIHDNEMIKVAANRIKKEEYNYLISDLEYLTFDENLVTNKKGQVDLIFYFKLDIKNNQFALPDGCEWTNLHEIKNTDSNLSPNVLNAINSSI